MMMMMMMMNDDAGSRTLRASVDELKMAIDEMCQEHTAAGKELGECGQTFAEFIEGQKKNRTKVCSVFLFV